MQIAQTNMCGMLDSEVSGMACTHQIRLRPVYANFGIRHGSNRDGKRIYSWLLAVHLCTNPSDYSYREPFSGFSACFSQLGT